MKLAEATDNYPQDRRFAPLSKEGGITNNHVKEGESGAGTTKINFTDPLPNPINNYVLLKVKNDNSKIRFENGLILYLDTSFKQYEHMPVVAEVMKCPETLFYKKGHPNSMPWKTQMELKVGDEVIIDYISYANAFDKEEPRNFILDGQEYFFCRYTSIYVAKRKWSNFDAKLFWDELGQVTLEQCAKRNVTINGRDVFDVICLNGYMLCEPIEKEIKTNLIVPDYIKKIKNADTAILRYIGSMNDEYEIDAYTDGTAESGDLVALDKNCDLKLQADDHRDFYNDLPFFVVQRCFLFGIIQS